jgi:hypothetical protein
MRKIKNFKIPIYTYDILRRAKKRKVDLFSLGLADQDSAREYVSSLASSLEPSTVFDFISPGEDLAKREGSPMPGDGTLGLITLGASFEAKLAAITDPGLFRLAGTAAQIFAETSLKVVSELIEQEISAEGLTLGEPVRIFTSPALLDDEAQPSPERIPAGPGAAELLSAGLSRLNADKIGVRLEAGSLFPRHTFLFSLPWLAKKRKKPAAGPSAR